LIAIADGADWKTAVFEQTGAGKIVLAARQAIRDNGAKMPIWFYMAPVPR